MQPQRMLSAHVATRWNMLMAGSSFLTSTASSWGYIIEVSAVSIHMRWATISGVDCTDATHRWFGALCTHRRRSSGHSRILRH